MRALRDDKLVLVSGPPATGKTRVLQEVAALFEERARPVTEPGAAMPIQGGTSVPAELLPSPNRNTRATYLMVFNQSTRYGHVWRALEPEVGVANQFRISRGRLWTANEFALQADGAALMGIDELNRGPAVAVLGEGVVGLEADKRVADDGQPVPGQSFTFPMPDDGGVLEPYGISPHLYVLAAQNDADVSVAPIDVAWYRRFTSIRLEPKPSALQDLFGLDDLTAEVPDTPENAKAVYLAAVQAWARINERIIVGRSRDFQLGHGVFFRHDTEVPDTPAEALAFVRHAWLRIERHVEEIFFEEVEAIADALRVTATSSHPYSIDRPLFAEVERPVLDKGMVVEDNDGLYRLLKAIADS